MKRFTFNALLWLPLFGFLMACTEKDRRVSYECTLNVSGTEAAETALRKLAQQINRIAGCDFVEMNTDTPNEDYRYHRRKDFRSPIYLRACQDFARFLGQSYF
ncbi:MAG: hypothetical protein LIP08_00050 [Bacteroides sp.]|nr:hypothetical protein [Bacteroides sp.]